MTIKKLRENWVFEGLWTTARFDVGGRETNTARQDFMGNPGRGLIEQLRSFFLSTADPKVPKQGTIGYKPILLSPPIVKKIEVKKSFSLKVKRSFTGFVYDSTGKRDQNFISDSWLTAIPGLQARQNPEVQHRHRSRAPTIPTRKSRVAISTIHGRIALLMRTIGGKWLPSSRFYGFRLRFGRSFHRNSPTSATQSSTGRTTWGEMKGVECAGHSGYYSLLVMCADQL